MSQCGHADAVQAKCRLVHHAKKKAPHRRATRWVNSALRGNAETQFAYATVRKGTVAARRVLRLAAKQGDSDAQTKLGIYLRDGLGGPKDGPEARRMLGLAAAQGSATAQLALGKMLAEGVGGDKIDAEARRLLRLATDQGCCEARFELAYMLTNGICGERDDEKARQLYHLAFEGHKEDVYRPTQLAAMCHLGTMHFKGIGGPKSVVEATRLFELAATHGWSDGQYRLACILMNESDESARRLLELAAAQNNVLALVHLAKMCNTGKGGVKDQKKGRHLLRLASDLGSVNAKLKLGLMLAAGIGGDENQEEAQAIWYSLANSGHDEAAYFLAKMLSNESTEKLAHMLCSRIGGAKDDVEGRRLYMLAAEKGSTISHYALAQMFIRDGETSSAMHHLRCAANLGHIESMALLAQKLRENDDHTEAYVFTRIAAEKGHASSQYILAGMHFNGIGEVQDYTRARELYECSAAQGNVDAMRDLAKLLLLQGHYDDARPMLESAASNGCAYSQTTLATMLFNGICGPFDYVKSVDYYKLAVSQGYGEAQYLVATLIINKNDPSLENVYRHLVPYFSKLFPEVNLRTYALGLLRLSATQGYGKAILKLGIITHDTREKMQLLERASAMGIPEAQYELGKFLEHTGDIERATTYYRCAVSKNSTKAMCALGDIFARGLGGGGAIEARQLYETAISLGCTDARERAMAMSDAAMDALLTEEQSTKEEKKKADEQSGRKKKKKKNKKPVKDDPESDSPEYELENAGSEKVATEEVEDEADGKCVVCWVQPPTHCFVPCGHLCVCSVCANDISDKSSSCPYCRATSSAIIRVYRP